MADITKNAEADRYEAAEGGERVGLIDYTIADGVASLTHTEVDPAHGGKGIAAHKIAHDDAVGGVVHLLQQVAEDQRQGKQQQAFYNAALGHKGSGIPCFYGGHGAPPLSAKNRLYPLA